ncbi:phosphate regulon sensor histidine kinase PhoR [Diaphorobacter sp. HDW4A]|uniref:phosphate regulon sensor histidine kinase PhoR n=1 Tax=Diaphorobacter sp. HDW4A TaxID=2714924 RepID=UPI00140E31DE|nr:phosphate regulon sensor histidine kinase PhoR [Diaphorobacter sp. HDW4A]QIL80701.1 phosphate regulon sensor histidine kinase PhoR [Diaphorobacter sp. HDW4A]
MLWRFFFFIAFQIAGGALGWWEAGLWGAAAGVSIATWVWFIWDFWRGSRVLRWLRQGDPQTAPSLRGMWGEAADRARRLARQAQLQIKASDARLHDILSALQASPNGVVLLDEEGHIEWCNQMAEAHFGFDAGRDLMQSVGNLVRDPDFTAYYNAQNFSRPVALQGRSSTPTRPVRISVQLYPYGDGRKLLLSQDITALEQAEAMRRDFVANVSHEIRTPLTVLTGFVETLQTLQLTEDEQQRYLGMMSQQAARMQSVVQDLLTLSRLEGSPLPGMSDWMPVEALLRRSEEEAEGLSATLTVNQKKHHDIVFPSAEAMKASGQIAGIVTELQSALSNLVNNAVRYTPPGGTITVSWEMLDNGNARFAVSDTGVGIAPEHIPRLTERFYRVDRSRSRETGGTGLGLAIVKHAVQRHGATLQISSVLGKGSTFAVVFPASRVRGSTVAVVKPPMIATALQQAAHSASMREPAEQ